MSDPTAPPPCSPAQIAAWRAEEHREAERITAAAEYERRVAAGEIPPPESVTEDHIEQDHEVRAARIWQTALSELQLQMTKATFDTWVEPTFAIAFDEEARILTVGVRNAYAKQWLENRLYNMIERTLNHCLGKPVQIVFVLKTLVSQRETN